MNRRSFFIAISASIIAAAPVFAEPMDQLGREMHAMGGDFKVLSQQINDAPSNASSLQLVDDLETHTMAAKGMTPPMIERATAADRPKMLAKYRSDIAKLIQQELDLEQALLADDNPKAATMLNKIRATERQGHSEFRRRG